MLDAQAQEFLVSAGWARARVTPIAGDLSARAFSRLKLGDKTAVLMDSTSDLLSADAFSEVTERLKTVRASVPKILACDGGLFVLEDFGDIQLGRLFDESPSTISDRDCIELLLDLRTVPVDGLTNPSAVEMANWMGIAAEYPGCDADALSAFQSQLTDLLKQVLVGPPALSLRDLHAENIMWLADRDGLARFGLLDYQDAFATHPAYDVMSFLTDARRQVSRERRAAFLSEYLMRSGDDPDAFRAAFSVLGVQRNVRILGVFARSAMRDRKTQHVNKIPRVYGYVCALLENPIFEGSRNAFEAAFPVPDDDFLARLK